jgi:hypothetical protein
MITLLLILLLLPSCTKSEVIMEAPYTRCVDTTSVYTPRVKADTNKLHPIRFDVHITDWEDYDFD